MNKYGENKNAKSALTSFYAKKREREEQVFSLSPAILMVTKVSLMKSLGFGCCNIDDLNADASGMFSEARF